MTAENPPTNESGLGRVMRAAKYARSFEDANREYGIRLTVTPDGIETTAIYGDKRKSVLTPWELIYAAHFNPLFGAIDRAACDVANGLHDAARTGAA